jgi:PEP-CTERM motif
MKRTSAIGFSVLIIASGLFSEANATTYNGNGNTGFGGPLGTGSLTLSDNGTTVSGTFTRGSGNFNDPLVIYIDSVSGGFNTTLNFNDQADSLRRSISGVGGFGRSTVNFASGFNADYAIALGVNGPNFGGLWSLANGNDNSLNFVASVNLTPNNNTGASSYSFSFDLSQIGLTGGTGTPFNFVASVVAESGFRSNEAIGASDAPGGNSNIAGGTLNFSSAEMFVPVPEPSSFALLGMGALGTLVYLRRRK